MAALLGLAGWLAGAASRTAPGSVPKLSAGSPPSKLPVPGTCAAAAKQPPTGAAGEAAKAACPCVAAGSICLGRSSGSCASCASKSSPAALSAEELRAKGLGLQGGMGYGGKVSVQPKKWLR